DAVSSVSDDGDQFSLNLSRYARLVHSDEDIDFGANAEIRKVDARLDGKTSRGDKQPLIVRFEIVHVGAGAVNFLADGVSGAMDKIFAEAFVSDMSASRVVHFE